MLDILMTILFFGVLGIVLLAFANFGWVTQEEHDNEEEERRIYDRDTSIYTIEWEEGTEELVTWEQLLEIAPEEARKYL